MANTKVTSLEQNILKTQRHLDLVGSYFSKKKKYDIKKLKSEKSIG